MKTIEIDMRIFIVCVGDMNDRDKWRKKTKVADINKDEGEE